MGTIGNPRTWVPYMNTKDCSQGFCSLYCPQWCYIIFPPPPPFDFPEDDEDSGPNFSPLVIAIIGILASAFLLVSYYAVISKYCRNRDSPSSRRRRREDHSTTNVEMEDNIQDPSVHEPWHVPTNGLDEALIKSITVFKYKKSEDGLTHGTDCSVCLSEFQEDESLRLLPKCSHAFHLPCIDTWLKSHSNCPLCRANIALTATTNASLPPPAVMVPLPPTNEARQETHQENENRAVLADDSGTAEGEDCGDSGNLADYTDMIEIRVDGDQHIRRSVSMDNSFQGRLSIADVLLIDDFEGDQEDDVGTSKQAVVLETRRSSDRDRVLHCVTSPVAMKRSFSSGRFLYSKRGRTHRSIIPL